MTWNVCQSFRIDKCRVLLLLRNVDYNRMRHLLFLKLTFIASRARAIDKGYTWKWLTTHLIVCNIGYQASNWEAQGLSINDTRIMVFTLTKKKKCFTRRVGEALLAFSISFSHFLLICRVGNLMYRQIDKNASSFFHFVSVMQIASKSNRYRCICIMQRK